MVKEKMKFYVLSFFLLFTFSCTTHQNLDKRVYVISGTFLEVISSYKEAAPIVYSEFKRLDKIFNFYSKDSELWKVNHSGGKEVKVSPEFIEVMKLAKSAYDITDGVFDVTAGAIYSFWKDFIKKKDIDKFPSREEIDRIKMLKGWEFIDIDEKKRTVRIRKEGIMIDLGGIAKGYMVDKAIQKLKELGIRSALINAGGDIYCLGDINGNAWRVGIRDPQKEGKVIDVLKLKDAGVATSGGYEQFFFVGKDKKKKYSHIIDPRTGMPVQNNVLSVTVVLGNTTSADIFATAFFVKGVDGVENFFRNKYSNMKVVLVIKDKAGRKIRVFN